MGSYLALNALATAVGAIAGGLLSDRFGPKVPFVIGWVAALAALLVTLAALKLLVAQGSPQLEGQLQA